MSRPRLQLFLRGNRNLLWHISSHLDFCIPSGGLLLASLIFVVSLSLTTRAQESAGAGTRPTPAEGVETVSSQAKNSREIPFGNRYESIRITASDVRRLAPLDRREQQQGPEKILRIGAI